MVCTLYGFLGLLLLVISRADAAARLYFENATIAAPRSRHFFQRALLLVQANEQIVSAPKLRQFPASAAYTVEVKNFTALVAAVEGAPKDNLTTVTVKIVHDLNFSKQINISSGQAIRFEAGTAGDIVLDAQHKMRLFNVSLGSVSSFSSFIFRNGFSYSTDSDSAKSCGGAIFVNGHVIYIENSAFVDNEAFAEGGAVYTNLGQIGKISNCIFRGNRAINGGGLGIYDSGALTLLSNCLFVSNNAGKNMYFGLGGAIHVC